METGRSTSFRRSTGVGGAAFVTVLGGAAALAAAFLTWSSLGTGRVGRGLSLRGMTLPSGKVALIGGIALVILGVGLWLVQNPEARRWLALAAVVLGGVVVGAAIAELQSEVTALARDMLSSDRLPAAARKILERGLGRGLENPARGPGVFLALTGGLVALAGGLSGVFWTTVPAPRPAVGADGGGTRAAEAFSKGRTA